ncbi:prolipoprotein diacylglyceryl transferase [Candidatus Dependentiae bacterium]
MYPRLLHIYGPVWIHSYGVMIAIGFALFLFLTHRHIKKLKLMSENIFFNMILVGLISGIIGGRLFFVISEWNNFSSNYLDFFYPWVGGFGVLGSIIAILATVSIYLKINKINILPIFDVVSIYAPLLQSISRLGCFFAGCCYGNKVNCDFIFAIKFSSLNGLAPINVWLHPTQLYSAIASLGIFLIMYLSSKYFYDTSLIQKSKQCQSQLICLKKNGHLIFLYLILESTSRFFIDFWRGDRNLVNLNLLNVNLSFSQITAICLFVFSFLSFILILKKK